MTEDISNAIGWAFTFMFIAVVIPCWAFNYWIITKVERLEQKLQDLEKKEPSS